MYRTCLFCNQDLGTNDIVEAFPVGRRLAFDAAKGRLWVVCRRCERWNLTPLEERWEAIEECERQFSSTRLRVSTDNIGLARLREGLELVRIGAALRPEMAAWRYGDQFGRRRRKYLLVSGGAMVAAGGIVVLGPATGLIAGGGWMTWQIVSNLFSMYNNRRVRTRLRLPESDRVIAIRRAELEHATLVRVEDRWAVRVTLGRGLTRRRGRAELEHLHGPPRRAIEFTGREALRAAGKLLPAINESGAKAAEVHSAVQILAEAGEPERLFQRYAHPGSAGWRRDDEAARGHVLHRLPKEVRIALEMASHEEQERRALEGELALLEAAWREAEEVAKIADDMFAPDTAVLRLRAVKQEG